MSEKQQSSNVQSPSTHPDVDRDHVEKNIGTKKIIMNVTSICVGSYPTLTVDEIEVIKVFEK